MSKPQDVLCPKLEQFRSDLARIKAEAEKMCTTSKEQFGADSKVTYRIEDVSNSIQRLEWEFSRTLDS